MALFRFALPLAISCCALAQTAVYLDPHQPAEKRAEDLVSRMTLEEKASQMQNRAAAIPRLHVPSYDWWSEALHGVARAGYATVFPQAIGMAATWDRAMILEEAGVIATEARAKFAAAQAANNHTIFHGLDFWSPNINIFRDPRWGRGQETYGEDPYLTGSLAEQFIHGLQGDDPRIYKTIATAKHYAVHSGPESTRHKANVDPSAHDLEDTYLPAFRMAMVNAKADSIMCSYNAVNGTPACANTMLLGTTLRQDWKFNGYVVSDCGAISDFFSKDGHHFSPDAAHASALAVKAGDDLSCGDEYAALPQAVKQGLITEQEIDQSVIRLFTARIRLGLFDPPGSNAYSRITPAENDTPANRDKALKAAREAIVLLTNAKGTLPLRNIRTLAVVGPNAEDLRVLEGNYNGAPSHPITPLDGIRQRFTQAGAKVAYAQGAPQVAELPVVVPSSAFGSGLKAEYYSTPDLGGAAVTATDSHIDFDWNEEAPPQIPQAKDYSVRWTGMFTPVAAGNQQFEVALGGCYPCGGTSSYKVFFGDKQVAGFTARGEQRNARQAPFTVHFDSTQPVPFRLEYAQQGERLGAGLSLRWRPPVEALRAEAVAMARNADAVVALVGLSPELEGEEMPVHIPGFSGGDRTDIALPQVQRQLLEALGSTGKPLIVVLTSGSALAADWSAGHADALLEAWYPGEQGGRAIAEVLAGDTNPAGRLPVTFYRSVDDLPPFDDYAMSNRTYRYFRGKPLFGFGYGLSYSAFAYSNLSLGSGAVQAGLPLHVEADVENTSPVAGDEVVELYLQPANAAPGSPIRWLAGFTRVHLDPHQVQHVNFDVSPRSLSLVDANGARKIAAGSYKLFIGGAQPDETKSGVSGAFTIEGGVALPR